MTNTSDSISIARSEGVIQACDTSEIRLLIAAAEESLKSVEANQSSRGQDYLTAAIQLGRLYLRAGDHEKAVDLLTEAGGVANSPNLPVEFASETLNLLGSALLTAWKPETAENVLREALRLKRSVVDPNDPSLDEMQFLLALACKANHKCSEAAALLRNVVKLRASMADADRSRYATGLYELSAVYLDAAEYARAETNVSAAMEVQGHVNSDSMEMAEVFAAQARLYTETGRFPGAKQSYDEAFRLAFKHVGDRHPRLYGLLIGAADLHRRICDYGSAMMFLDRAFEIAMQFRGDRFRPVDVLVRKAQVRIEDYDLEKAQFNLDRAIELSTAFFGSDERTDAVVARQAPLLEAKGDYSSAEVFRRVLVRRSKEVFGPKHPAYAAELASLGLTQQARGAFRESESTLQEAAAIIESRIGPNAPDLAPVLGSLGDAYAANGNCAEALAAMRRCEEINDRTIGQAFAVMGEAERLRFAEMLRPRFWKVLSLVLLHFATDPDATEFAYTLVLKRKALAIESGMVLTEGLLTHNKACQAEVQRLSSLRAEIVKLFLHPIAQDEAWTNTLHEKLSQKQLLEAHLARHIPEMNIVPLLRETGTPAVRALLPEGVALLEYVQCSLFDFGAAEEKGDAPWGAAHYLLFAMEPQGKRRLEVFDIGESAVVDKRVAYYRDALAHPVPLQISVFDEADIEDGKEIRQRRGQKLRELIIDPAAKHLTGARRILIAADGELNRVPFGAFPVDDGVLLQHHQISYLSCGRDLIRFNAPSEVAATEPLVVAAPLFDGEVAGRKEKEEKPEDAGRTFFEPLEGTRREGNLVHRLIGGRLAMDAQATFEEVWQARSPVVLHLATHGFFSRQSSGGGGPLLQSGLALAFANSPMRDERTDAGGLLVAEQVRDMNLLGTRLVVLSACDTGLGDIKVGEGVFGLRYAFLLAGARTLVMSLWRVPDKQTQQLMKRFYRHLAFGCPAVDALQRAQLEMRQVYSHPLYWAGFVPVGDPDTELDTKTRASGSIGRFLRKKASPAAPSAAPSATKCARSCPEK